MTDTSKHIIINLIEKRIRELNGSIIMEEKSKQNVKNNPQYFEHPSNEIKWHNTRIRLFKANLKDLNDALNEINQL